MVGSDEGSRSHCPALSITGIGAASAMKLTSLADGINAGADTAPAVPKVSCIDCWKMVDEADIGPRSARKSAAAVCSNCEAQPEVLVDRL